MKEEIEDIARCIQQDRDGKILIDATNNAVGRFHMLYGNQEKLFWLVNKQVTEIGFQRTSRQSHNDNRAE